jgi:hypothetical protein
MAEPPVAVATLIEAAPPPPPPPPPVVTPVATPPAAIDAAWHLPVPEPSFAFSRVRTTAAVMFGLPGEALGPDAQAARVGRIVAWLRGQQDAPWGELDGILRTIRFATGRLSREPLGSVSWGAELGNFMRVLKAAEADVERRLVGYLQASDQERARETARSTFEARRDEVSQAQRPQDFIPPAFDAAKLIPQLEARGVRFTLSDQIGGGFSFGPGDRLLPSELMQIHDFKSEVEMTLRAFADAIGD